MKTSLSRFAIRNASRSHYISPVYVMFMVKLLHQLLLICLYKIHTFLNKIIPGIFQKVNDMVSSATLINLTGLISKIDDNFDHISTREIIISVCNCFMGPPESLLRLNGRNEMEQSSRFLNSLLSLMSKIINDVQCEETLKYDERILNEVDLSTVTCIDEHTVAFEISWYYLCIYQDLYHKVRHIRSMEPPGDIDSDEYSTLILPALVVLEDGFMVLRNVNYDFICSQFYDLEEFKIANARERVFADYDYLPLHPCNGPLSNSLKDKAVRIKDILDYDSPETECFWCENCTELLTDLSHVAVWEGCQCWCFCVLCAETAFFGFINHEVHDSNDDELTWNNNDDRKVAAAHVLKNKTCYVCRYPITKWTKGKYIIESVQMHETVPSPYPGQYVDRWYVHLFHRIKLSILGPFSISFTLALLFHSLSCYLEKLKKEDPATHARNNNVFFNFYNSLLACVPFNPNGSFPFLAVFNILGIEEAFDSFVMKFRRITFDEVIGSSVTSHLNLDTLSVVEAIRRKVVSIRIAIFNRIRY